VEPGAGVFRDRHRGSFIGGRVETYVSQDRLKRGLTVSLVLMDVVILGQNVMEMVG
jgi:hypothetical protein